MDSSKKTVYQCDVCHKWFCESHQKAKLPYFVEWETMFDVQGNPEVKALFYSEYRRQDGHPDFVHLRKTVEALELEEKTKNALIKQVFDRMNDDESVLRWRKLISTPERENELELSGMNLRIEELKKKKERE